MDILQFQGEHRYLSNFYNSKVGYGGFIYQNAEAAFQAQKTDNKEYKERFTRMDPREAKRFGRKVPLRSDWEEVKNDLMLKIIYCKFLQNKDLGDLLLSTGDCYLEEGNTWGDRHWGTVNRVGKNILGKCLMIVRKKLRNNEVLDISPE